MQNIHSQFGALKEALKSTLTYFNGGSQVCKTK